MLFYLNLFVTEILKIQVVLAAVGMKGLSNLAQRIQSDSEQQTLALLRLPLYQGTRLQKYF